MNNTQFNQDELNVLEALRQQVIECTGNEFGYMADVDRGQYSKHEFAGYISALKKKEVFEYLSEDFGGQYALKQEYFNAQ